MHARTYKYFVCFSSGSYHINFLSCHILSAPILSSPPPLFSIQSDRSFFVFRPSARLCLHGRPATQDGAGRRGKGSQGEKKGGAHLSSNARNWSSLSSNVIPCRTGLLRAAVDVKGIGERTVDSSIRSVGKKTQFPIRPNRPSPPSRDQGTAAVAPQRDSLRNPSQLLMSCVFGG